jgi:nucleotide-binding universal stress UspA family protein
MIRLGWPRGLASNPARGIMFSAIVVGTDGSETATQAVRQAVDMAGAVGATLELVSAFAPVPEQRLKAERRDAPEDVQWAINPVGRVNSISRVPSDARRESRGRAERVACSALPRARVA